DAARPAPSVLAVTPPPRRAPLLRYATLFRPRPRPTAAGRGLGRSRLPDRRHPRHRRDGRHGVARDRREAPPRAGRPLRGHGRRAVRDARHHEPDTGREVPAAGRVRPPARADVRPETRSPMGGGGLRVAMLIQRYLPHVGGAELQLAALAPLLRDRGVEIAVFTRAMDEPGRYVERGTEIYRL